MLAEAYELRQSLDEMDFDVPTTHPNVLSPGRTAGYRIRLGKVGQFVIEELGSDEMASLWYHIEGKQNAFPVVKVQHALLTSSDATSWRKRAAELKHSDDARRIALLREALDNWRLSLPPKDEQAWTRLGAKASEWQSIFNSVPDRFIALPTMLERFVAFVARLRPSLQELATHVVEGLEQGHLTSSKLAESLLIGKDPAPGKPALAGVPLAFDVTEINAPMRIGESGTRAYVSGRLLEVKRPDDREPKELCALSATERVLLRGAFPEVQLPGLGNTKLFSKYDATPCEFRYVKTPRDWKDRRKSFPIGEDIAANIADGLRALTSRQLRGKTWRMVANGKWEGTGKNRKEKRDLLVVYCEGQPVISDEAADTFGNDGGETHDQFANDARGLCRALEGIIKHRPASHLHLLIIGKADKEKKQVLMHLTPTLSEVLHAAERWQRAVSDNLPEITIPLPPKKKGEVPIRAKPLPPYPDRVVRLLSSQWVRAGTDERKLQGPALRTVLDAMLRTPGRWDGAVEDLINLTVQRIGPLIVGVAAALKAGTNDQLKKFPPPAREAALRGIAVLAILLDALGRERKTYMNDTAFQLGRLLALADSLHREYCVHVRSGSIPPQLIGNALMPAAADNPEDAVDRLRERMSIYQAWANKSLGEDFRLAKWVVGQMGEICNVIKRPLPTNTDRTFRAELFIGYLSRPTKEDRNPPKETLDAG